MKVIKITPRGYCYGVADALTIARKVMADENTKKPVYLLGQLIHNKKISDALDNIGIITLDQNKSRLELLEKIDNGTVIFTAHGVSPQVKKLALEKKLDVVDATCPDVTKTHDLIAEKISEGYEIIYIGKKGHPEPEGVLGISPEKIHLIQTLEDFNNLETIDSKIIITNQTTMSLWDVAKLSNEICKVYPNAEFLKEICNATQERQEAVANFAKDADLTIVVGDAKSNNANRLVQVSKEKANTQAYRISTLDDLNTYWLKDVEVVAVTSGASTPTAITNEVIDFIEKYDPEINLEPKSKIKLERLVRPVNK